MTTADWMRGLVDGMADSSVKRKWLAMVDDLEAAEEMGVTTATRCSPEHPCTRVDELHLMLWGQCYTVTR